MLFRSNAHINNILVVNGFVDARTSLDAAPLVEPKGELHIRYEPDTKRMYITVASIRRHCALRQISYKTLLDQLQQRHVFLGLTNKRMTKGMKITAPPSRVMELDTSRDEFLNMDAYAPVQENADREGELQH